MAFEHVPVLLDEVLEWMQPKADGVYCDGTLGGGGHSAEILRRLNGTGHLYGIDRDEPVETVKAFAEKTGVTYPLALDPGADHFAKYADRKAGITRNVLIDKEGKIVMLTRLYNEEEFATLCKKIDEMLAE